MSDATSVRIFGIDVARSNSEEALATIGALVAKGGPALVAYANANTMNVAWEDPEYGEVLRGADIVLNDGVGVQMAARMRGQRFPANLNGSDLNPMILELAARRGWKVFLLGAADGVAEEAAARLSERFSGLTIVGTHHGYPTDDDEVVRMVRAAGADLLMVAMGNPAQESWLHSNLSATGAKVGIGVGAFFDFTAGAQKRAPAWMNKVGLEWLHRLARDPGRLWRRYVVGNPVFLWRAWKTRRTDTSGAR